MSDPSLLISRPTATDPSLAPPGRHLHYVLAPCPNTDLGPGTREWTALAPAYRDHLLRVLEQRGLDGLGAAVEAEALVTPSTGPPRATRRAAPSRPPTPSPRPARSAPATWCAAPPTPYWRAAARRPASASPPC